MSDAHAHSDSPESIKKHNKLYVVIFLLLLVGTAVTVGLNYMHFDSVVVTVAIALFVAIIKASLVAGYFMHLISEKKAIYIVLATTVFFFAGLMTLIVWSHSAMPSGMEYSATKYVPKPIEPMAK